jgi:16S rRNA (uracil1498-N3)-methyltransferase
LNFLLLRPDEIDGAGHATLRGRRADHVRTVLRATLGQELKAGVLGGLLGTATVTSVESDAVAVAASLQDEPAPTPDVLLLAVPRPKVLLRMLAHAAALGFGRIVLFRSWRVEKSHLLSTAMCPEVQREQLLLGLEQAGRTRLPAVQFFPLFKPMVEDHLPGDLPDTRFVAHPAAPTNTHELALGPGSPFALALGPDGGFLPYEVARLAERGFLPISCGRHPQRTETALAVLWGQLALLRARGSLRA